MRDVIRSKGLTQATSCLPTHLLLQLLKRSFESMLGLEPLRRHIRHSLSLDEGLMPIIALSLADGVPRGPGLAFRQAVHRSVIGARQLFVVGVDINAEMLKGEGGRAAEKLVVASWIGRGWSGSWSYHTLATR
jgi:hypothetical protein